MISQAAIEFNTELDRRVNADIRSIVGEPSGGNREAKILELQAYKLAHPEIRSGHKTILIQEYEEDEKDLSFINDIP